MIKILSKLIKILTIGLIIFTAKIYAQDSAKIILLSRNIGPSVSVEEKQKYNLLPQIQKNFVSAVYYFSPDSFYCCKVRLQENGHIKDTIIILNYYSLKNTVMRVQLLDKSKMGNLNVNHQEFEFIFANGENVEKIIKSYKPKILKKSKEQHSPSVIELDTLKVKKRINKPKNSTYLPINNSNNNYSKFIKNNFYFGIGAGITWINSNFEGLTRIFNQLENTIPAPGYSLSKTKYEFGVSPVVRISSSIIISERYFLELMYLFDLHGGSSRTVDFSGSNASIGYMLPILKTINLQISLGYTGIEFIATRVYNQAVDNERSLLEKIELKRSE